MKTLLPWMLPLCLALATSAEAQRRPGTQPPPPSPAQQQQPQTAPPQPQQAPAAAAAPPPPAAQAPAPGGSGGERQISPSRPVPGPGPNGTRPIPDCEQVRRRARYSIYFDKVEIEKLVQTVSDATCKTFILPENVRGRISIIGPENGKVEVDAEAFYAAFLAALDSNGLAVYPHGRFLKIVDKRSAKQTTIPTFTEPGADYTTNEQMITKLFRIRYVEVEPLRGVLQQLVTKDGDTIPYPPDTLIINDIGSNIHRLERIIRQLDRPASGDEVRTLQVQYASAQDVAATVQKIFEGRPRPGQRPGTFAPTPAAAPPGGAPGGSVPAPGLEPGSGPGGPVTLNQIIPDERTNKLIIVASPAAFEKIEAIVREIDVPISGEGRINVYYLENANAEEVATTLQSLAQGSSSPRPGGGRAGGPGPGGAAGAAAARPGAVSAELFSGEVKISADKGTNSLVIVASQSDYRNLVRVIEKLDVPRRQVFVEAVIMEVNLDRNTEFGINLHSGYTVPSPSLPGNLDVTGQVPGLFATSYSRGGLPPSLSLGSLASFGGFLAGIQGPVIPALREQFGIDIPAFGLILHALQQSSDVNVLSTPHLLTSDNEEAEITVGQNVPFQAGFSPGNIGSALGGTTTAAGFNTSLLAGLGGLGSAFAPITRQNVELKLTVKPQINESDFIRMAISEQTEEIASSDPVLGPTTSKRSAKTVVVAKDQETVVLGGIMQDRTVESVNKVPILGDVPILGHLFRETTRRKQKTNLLLFLTPYIIRTQEDFRRIFERKMKERQQFVEQFYGQSPGYDVAVDFGRKPGPLGRMTRTVQDEQRKAENGGPGAAGERVIRPGESPGEVRPRLRPPTAPPAQPPGPEGSLPLPPPPAAPPEAPPAEPEVREGTPPPPGSPESTLPPPQEELRVQPGTDQERN